MFTHLRASFGTFSIFLCQIHTHLKTNRKSTNKWNLIFCLFFSNYFFLYYKKISWKLIKPFSIYLGESKVLHYFSNVRYNSTAPNAFVEIVKVTNPTRLWDTKLACVSASDTRRICFCSLDHGLRIDGFRLTWSSRFLQAAQNYLNHLVTVLHLNLLHNNFFFFVVFWLLPWYYDPVQTRKL